MQCSCRCVLGVASRGSKEFVGMLHDVSAACSLMLQCSCGAGAIPVRVMSYVTVCVAAPCIRWAA